MREKLGIQLRKRFRRPRIDRNSLFVFVSGQLIKAWILSGRIVLCWWDMESPRSVTSVSTTCALDRDTITPGSQGPKKFGIMLEAEFSGWTTKEEVIYVLEEMTWG